MAENKELKAVVKEGLQNDIGKKVARISSNLIKELDLIPGDTIEISGKRKTIATVLRDQDEGIINEPNFIRIDGIVRHNSKTSLGEKVLIKKVISRPANSITIALLEDTRFKNIRFAGDPTHFFKEKLMEKPFAKGDQIVVDIMGNPLHYIVTNITPKGYVKITPDTKLTISEKTVSPKEISAIPEVTYEDIGGLHEEIDQIREMVELPMKHPEVFEKVGISAPKGVLLTGPPGTGKTLLAKAVASETDSQFFSINGPEIMSKFYGESEKQLREIFEKADKEGPSIIFIDEIDSIAANRAEVTGELERRVVSQLLTLMDGLKGRGQVVVVAATNRADVLDPALRRPGRFDREIVINVPNINARKEILQIQTRGMPLDDGVSLDKLSEITLAYTGADLEVLCKEAALKSLKNWIPDLKKTEEKVPTNVLDKIKVKMKHFIEAFRKVEPSAMREVLIAKPNTKYEDIGGLDKTKQLLKEVIEWPLKKGEMFKKTGITPPKGIILSGPPGTGKTLLAKAVANESEANFISVKGPELISKWVGESEKHVRELFKKARQVAPSIIFFDEFDSIAAKRSSGTCSAGEERVVNQLLTELDGIEELSGVTVIAATNRVDLVDNALLRPGRFDQIIELELPDTSTREQIFNVHVKYMPIKSQTDIHKLVDMTENMSGAEIANICKEAGMNAIRRAMEKDSDEVVVIQEDFKEAVDKIKNKLKLTQSSNVSYIA